MAARYNSLMDRKRKKELGLEDSDDDEPAEKKRVKKNDELEEHIYEPTPNATELILQGDDLAAKKKLKHYLDRVLKKALKGLSYDDEDLTAKKRVRNLLERQIQKAKKQAEDQDTQKDQGVVKKHAQTGWNGNSETNKKKNKPHVQKSKQSAQHQAERPVTKEHADEVAAFVYGPGGLMKVRVEPEHRVQPAANQEHVGQFGNYGQSHYNAHKEQNRPQTYNIKQESAQKKENIKLNVTQSNAIKNEFGNKPPTAGETSAANGTFTSSVPHCRTEGKVARKKRQNYNSRQRKKAAKRERDLLMSSVKKEDEVSVVVIKEEKD